MTQTTELVDALRDLDQAIDTAISAQNASVLESVLADDFIYAHSNGWSQPKSEFIEAIGRREDPPRRALSNVEVEPHAGIVVTRGDLDIQYHDSRPDLYMRYVRVYRQVGNGWQACSQRVASVPAVGASAPPGRSAGLGFGPPLNLMQ